MTELLTGAFDDEEFLALGSINTLRGDDKGMTDTPFFAAYHKASKTCVADTVQAAMTAAMTGVVVDMPTGVKAGKEKKKTKKELAAEAKANAVAPPPAVTGTANTAQPAGDDFAPVIKMLHEHRLASEEGLGAMIGVSRGTINNVVKKDRACPLSAAHQATLKEAINARIVGLQTALALLP